MLGDDITVVTQEAGTRLETWTAVAGVGLGGLAVGAAVLARRRAARREGTIAAVFWRDAATALIVVGATAAIVALALVGGVEGLGDSLWVLVTAIGGVALAAVLAWNWTRRVQPVVQLARPLVPTGAPERTIVSSAWEIGIGVAAVVGLLFYLGTADHAFGHPIHWVLAIVGGLLGYALGIGAATPRFRLESPTRRR